MSKNVYWREAPRPPEPLGRGYHPLKGLIARLCYGHDGSLRSEPIIVESGTEFESYLVGYLMARDDEEVRSFLADLREHKRLEVWIDD